MRYTTSPDEAVELFWRTLVEDWNSISFIPITHIQELPRRVSVSRKINISEAPGRLWR